jgi:enoyl-CoA hydratase/carnithine racemase
VLDGVRNAVAEFEEDESVRAMITRGAAGDYSAGADVDAFQDGEGSVMSTLGGTRRAQQALESASLPTVAAIDGYALGGGLELAACHDFRIAEADAQLGFPEINIGIFPGAGGTQCVPRLIGVPKTKELIFTGEMISGEEAESIGLVDKLADSEDAETFAREFAGQFTDKPPVALAAAKSAINEVWNGRELREGLLAETAASEIVFDTEDRQEGMEAFDEDREPTWRGR